MSRQRVADQVLRDPSATVGAFLDVITGEIPAYRSLDPRQLEEVRSIIGWALRRVLELWADGSELTAEDVRIFRGIGSARARDGRPLTAVLRAYRVAAPRFIDSVVAEYGAVLALSDVSALARVWMAVLDQVSEAIYEGYESATHVLGTDRQQSLQALLVDLVLGRQSHAGTLPARLRELDAELPAAFDLVVVAPGAGQSPLDAAGVVTATLAPEAAAGPGRELTSIGAALDGLGIALVKSVDATAFSRLVAEQALTGALVRAATVDSAPREHRLAVHALRNAPAMLWGRRPILDRGDLETIALTTGQPDADPSRLHRVVFGTLAGDPALGTLEALLLRDSAGAAAEELHLHAQTVRYRVRRIAAATGRDLRDPWDRFVLQAALLTR